MRVGLVREEGSAVSFTHDALRRVAYDRLSLARRRLLHARAAEALAAGRAARAAPSLALLPRRRRPRVALGWVGRRLRPCPLRPRGGVRARDFVAAWARDRRRGRGRQRRRPWWRSARYEAALVTPSTGRVAGRTDAERADRDRAAAADVHARRGEWALADAGLAAALTLAGDDTALRATLLADRAVVAVRAGTWPRPSTRCGRPRRGRSAGPYVANVAGLVALAADDHDSAIVWFSRAREALDRDPALEASVLNNLATAQAAAGSHDAAVTTARAALTLGEQLGDRHRLAALHANLVDRLHETGADEEAMTHLKQSAALFAEVGAHPLDRPEVWTLTAW